MRICFEELRRHVVNYVKRNDFHIAVEEEQRYHELQEIAGDCLSEFVNKHSYHMTTFFLICDELGLDETFKQLDLFGDGGD